MNNLKSISFLLFSTLFCSVNGISGIPNKKETINDLLEATDFDFYLKTLENLVDFYTRHKFYVNLNPAFGLFMVEANLRTHLQQQKYNIPLKIRSRLVKLLLNIGALSAYFHFMVQQMKSTDKDLHKREIQFSELFYNKTTWPRTPDKFHKDLLKHTTIYSPQELLQKYGEWDDYLKDVTKPPEKMGTLDDDCLVILASNPPSKYPKNCFPPARCNKRVEDGTGVGYSAYQWVFIMITARFSRQCFVFSEAEDKRELDTYCARYYHEIQYIAMQDFKQPIIASHHCALCGILGHAQFFKKFWHKKLAQYQTPEGCFSESIRVEKFEDSQTKEESNAGVPRGNLREKENEWNIATKSTFMNGTCSSLFTSVSLMTLSHALRFIIETYY